jgi:hypothetical protein
MVSACMTCVISYGYGYQPMAYVWHMAKNNGVMAMVWHVMPWHHLCMLWLCMYNRHVYV